jgi:glycosyltransferase involved in cell wall biosynthesis
MIRISAVVITHNEERDISRCLQSLKDITDEILVVDSFSDDRTVEIAQSAGAKVIQHPFNGYGEQKNYAQLQATYDWILNIDADEVISPELAKSILEVKQNPQHDAYKLNILTNYSGKWIRHSGWYPSYKLRFWNRTKGSMRATKVHEGWHLDDKSAKAGYLKGDLLHYSYDNISDHIRKIDHYTELGAKISAENGKNYSLFQLWFRPKWTFFSTYVLRLGFLDGYYGYVVCKISAFTAFLKYAKTREYNKKNKS